MALIEANAAKEGTILRLDKKLFKVISAETRGTAKLSRVIHLGLKSIPDGAFVEKSLKSADRVEQVDLDRHAMAFLYQDADSFWFMDQNTYEQLGVPKTIVGAVGPYLKENAEIQVEFYENSPVNILFPTKVHLKVTSCPPGIREQDMTTFKKATLENGMEILVPQFIKEGDTVEVDVESGKYKDRVKS